MSALACQCRPARHTPGIALPEPLRSRCCQCNTFARRPFDQRGTLKQQMSCVSCSPSRRW
eukprot:3941527-Rhodomonas_salina.1